MGTVNVFARAISFVLRKPVLWDAAALLLFLSMSLTFFGRDILFRQIYYEPDTVTYYFPIMSSVDRALLQSTIPLWTPYIFGGFPLFADGEAGMLYPINLLLLWLLPIQDAFVWLRVIRFFLAGAFTYAFVRSIQGSRTGAIVAGLVFAFGSFLVAQLHHTNVTNSAIWLPLVLFFVELALQGRALRRQVFLLLAGVAFGIQNLGVHVQPVLMTWLALSLYVAFRVLFTKTGSHQSEPQAVAAPGAAPQPVAAPFRVRGPVAPLTRSARLTPLSSWARRSPLSLWERVRVRAAPLSHLPLIAWAIAVVTGVGFGLAAIQLLPLYELGTFSARDGGVTYSFATLFSLPPFNLATLIFPYFFARPDGSTWSLWVEWESTVYVGIAPLVLALVAICFSKRRLAIFFAWLAFLSMLLAMGDYLPLKAYWMVWRLPGFSVMRVPARFSYLFVFSFAVLASMGMDWLMARLSTRQGASSPANAPPAGAHGRSWRVFLGALAAFTVVLALALVLGRYWLQSNQSAALQGIQGLYLQLRNPSLRLSAESVYDSLLYSLDLADLKTWQAILFLFVVVLLLLLWSRFRSRSGYWRTALVSLTVVDLMLFAIDFHPSVSLDSLSKPSQAVQFLEDKGGLFRVFNNTPGMRTEPNRLLPFRISSIGGYSSLPTRRYAEYSRAVERGAKQLLDLWNVRYVITWTDQPIAAGYKAVFQDGDIGVYENESFLPRAFLVESAVVVPPGRPALDYMESKQFDPAKTVVLEEPLEAHASLGSGGQAFAALASLGPGGQNARTQPVRFEGLRTFSNVEMIDYRREVVDVRIDARKNSFLVLTDSYYPGWRALVDGKETHIYRANYLFRGVYLPAGSHKVEFIFTPTLFEIGRAISIATLLLVVAVLAFAAYRSALRRFSPRNANS
ncbi:MAG: YfhO family protein [Chloroflexi bacterium]|nr:YfhO family protein [Chloroflexota bacterium]